MPIFWVKIDHNGKLPYQPNNPPGNRKMHQNIPQAMGIDVLDTFTPHPGAIPAFQVQVGPKMGGFGGKKQPKWQDAILSVKINLETG